MAEILHTYLAKLNFHVIRLNCEHEFRLPAHFTRLVIIIIQVKQQFYQSIQSTLF